MVYFNHKQLFPQIQDPIDRIGDIAQAWKNKEFGNQKHRKTLGKTLDIIEMKIKLIPKEFPFQMIFQPLLKQYKDGSFEALKHF